MTTSFATAAEARAYIAANNLPYDAGRFAEVGTYYVRGVRVNGVDEFHVVQHTGKVMPGRPQISERVFVTKTGKRSSSRIQCAKAFRKHAGDKVAFVAAAVALGVKRTTANTMFHHFTKGRYAAV